MKKTLQKNSNLLKNFLEKNNTKIRDFIKNKTKGYTIFWKPYFSKVRENMLCFLAVHKESGDLTELWIRFDDNGNIIQMIIGEE